MRELKIEMVASLDDDMLTEFDFAPGEFEKELKVWMRAKTNEFIGVGGHVVSLEEKRK